MSIAEPTCGESNGERAIYAHSLPGEPESRWETLDKHSENVAELARSFADAFKASDWGELLGRWHDLGKGSSQEQAAEIIDRVCRLAGRRSVSRKAHLRVVAEQSPDGEIAADRIAAITDSEIGNEARNERRDRMKRRSLQFDPADTTSSTPHEQLKRRETEDLSDQFLNSLPLHTREVMELLHTHRSEAASVSELAQRLGISRPNANKHHRKDERAGASSRVLRSIACQVA